MENYIKELLLDKLKYCEIDFGDINDSYKLALKLWETENINGSIASSTYEAEQWIGKYFSDLRDWVGYYRDEFESLDIDPFENPNGFMVCMVIFISYRMLSLVFEKGMTREELIQKIQEEF